VGVDGENVVSDLLLPWSNVANLRAWVLMRLRYADHYPDGLTGADIDAQFAAGGINVTDGYVNTQLRAMREIGLVTVGEPRVRPGITATPTYTLTTEGRLIADAVASAINRVVNTPVFDARGSWQPPRATVRKASAEEPNDDDEGGSGGGEIPGW